MRQNLVIILGIIGADQLSKWVAQGQGRAVINSAGVWGLFPGLGWTVIVCLVWLIILAFYFRHRSLGLTIILAAGLSNLIDRIAFGAVRDFIYYPVLNFYGNIADITLAIGAGLLIWKK